MSSPEEIKAEYASSLADLTFNSKPLINVLTMLAEENSPNAKVIVEAIETHLFKVATEIKLPILYLIDCIVKNVGNTYKTLFSQNIVQTFCGVFKAVDEKTRAEMFKLRQTWNDVFPQIKLYMIDVQINHLDPAWPVTAKPTSNSIHFNPKFLQNKGPSKFKTEGESVGSEGAGSAVDKETLLMQEKLIQKQKELLELQQKKLELEVLQTQVKLQEQIKSTSGAPATTNVTNILLKPEVAKQLAPSVTMKHKANSPRKNAPPIPPGEPRNPPTNQALPTRPIRDPRLLRQQRQQHQQQHQQQQQNTAQSNVCLGQKKNSLNVLENNKVVTVNKLGVRKVQNLDPRLVCKQAAGASGGPAVAGPKSPPKKTPNPLSPNPTAAGRSPKKARKARSQAKRQDEDLRQMGPAEKLARTQAAPAPASNVSTGKEMDVDLRRMPAIISGKKRPSVESDQPASKKGKTQSFDKLFGDEDTDLRRLPVLASNDRPPTPPAPIISSRENEREAVPERVEAKSNLDEVRAKLANAIGKNKIMSKSFNKKKMAQRSPPRSLRTDDPTGQKVIISPEDEDCIKYGTLSKQQEKQLLDKIILQMEKNKLKEAQNKIQDDFVQAISDEELVEDDPMVAKPRPTPSMAWERERERFAKQPNQDYPPDYQFYQQPRNGKELRKPWSRGGRRFWNESSKMSNNAPLQRGARSWNQSWRNFGSDLAVAPNSPDQSVDHLMNGAVNREEIKSINIDGVAKDIRFYDETAVVFMNWDDPREISFQDGVRRVIFNDSDSYLLAFNQPYQDVAVNGEKHSVRLGAPSREIYVDRVPYECYFGSAGIRIELDGSPTTVKLDGPPPQVKIGDDRRTDLVAGKINLFVDAKIIVPVFLDAKPQKFTLSDPARTSTLRFVDGLETVLIDDAPFAVEYGGLPKPCTIQGRKHFIRFSVLPKGCKPGKMSIKDMAGSGRAKLGLADAEENNSRGSAASADSVGCDGSLGADQEVSTSGNARFGAGAMVGMNRAVAGSSPVSFQNILQQGNLDLLSNEMALPIGGSAPTTGGYHRIENDLASTGADRQQTTPVPQTAFINDLFQKLVASGFVTTGDDQKPSVALPEPRPKETEASSRKRMVQQAQLVQPAQQAPQKKSMDEALRSINLRKPETLRVKRQEVFGALYAGMQCSSCGMRFSPEASMQYSQHLDWHFRQNRKGKRNVRVAASRRWYYSLADWKNYEELEDLEEREKNYFDQQQQQQQQLVEGAMDEGEEEAEAQSVPADTESTNECCEVCRDRFEQFFNEEKEEWHLRNAVKIDDKTYHPLCYRDYQEQSLITLDDSRLTESLPSEDKPDEPAIPGLEIIIDDEDDAPSPDEGSDGELDPPPDKEPEANGTETNEVIDDDDDVILNEVAPVKIVVDDDDDDRESVDSSGEPVSVKKEKMDDGFLEVAGPISLLIDGQIKIKSEPIDTGYNEANPEEQPSASDVTIESLPDDLTIVEREDEAQPEPSALRTEAVASMDGNIDIVTSTASSLGNKIKINISKPLTLTLTKEKEADEPASEDLEKAGSDEDPAEPKASAEVKAALKGVKLKKMDAVKKGNELTGLCSIM